MKTPNKFIITGCGRSGTTYIANLLSSIGCPCSHEAYFPGKLPYFIYLPLFNKLIFSPYHKVNQLKWPTEHCGEAAWQATPFLDLLPRNVSILHQVRHPLDFIRSRQKKGVLYGRLRSMFTSVKYHNINTFRNLSIEEQVDYLARFWIEWNYLVERKACKHKTFRYRIEDVDVFLFKKITDFIGFEQSIEELKAAYEKTSKKTNSFGDTLSDINLSMLSKPVYSSLENLANKYGYTL